MAKHRLQFDFTEEAIKEIDDLRSTADLPSRAELIRYSLKFLRWALRQIKEENGTLLIEKDGKIREVVFPFWSSSSGGTSLETKKEEIPKGAPSVRPLPEIAANQHAFSL